MGHDVPVRVLVVEDHVELARDIAEGLRDRGIATDVVHDGTAALERGLLHRYDVIVSTATCPASTATPFARRSATAARTRGY